MFVAAMSNNVAVSIGTGIVTGLIGAVVWCIIFAVILNVLPSSYVAVVVVFVLAGIGGAVIN